MMPRPIVEPVKQAPPATAPADVAALIPAWKPEARLLDLVSTLIDAGFTTILVVDDGSGPAFAHIFDELEQRPPVRVIRHAVNLGKGRALKTGFNYFLLHCPNYAGIVTADADGQHSPTDIVETARALKSHPDQLVIGSREFARGVPLRSRLGNILTRHIFSLLTGRKVSDTQSGLRCIPAAALPHLMRLEGERYEYEMTVLMDTCASEGGIAEVPIQTIYIDNNRGSHFNPVWDSMKIYFVLARFYASSLLAAGLDTVIFTIAFWLTHNVLTSIIAGRMSSLVNFAVNRRFVFGSHGRIGAALFRYYLLAGFIAAVAYFSIRFLAEREGVNVVVAKVLVETLLSLASFSIQRTFVFGARRRES